MKNMSAPDHDVSDRDAAAGAADRLQQVLACRRTRLVASARRRLESAPGLLVCAPVGYGKSALLHDLAHAAAGDGHRCIELTDDIRDDNLAAVRDAFCTAGVQTSSVAPPLDAAESVLTESRVTTGDAGAAQISLYVFIDEAHRMRPDIERMLTGVLRRGDNVRVVLSAAAPSAGIILQKAAGKLSVIDARALAFTRAEIVGLFADGYDPPTIARIAAETEGWPLAIRYLCERAPALGLTAALDDAARALVEPAFAGLAPDLQCFLLDTLPLIEIEPGLADALREACDSSQYIARIRNLQGLVRALDAPQAALARHPLLTRFLKALQAQRLNVSEAAARHARAARLLSARAQPIACLANMMESNASTDLDESDAAALLHHGLSEGYRDVAALFDRHGCASLRKARALKGVGAYYLMRRGRLHEAAGLLRLHPSADAPPADNAELLLRASWAIYAAAPNSEAVSQAIRQDIDTNLSNPPLRLGLLNNSLGQLDTQSGRLSAALKSHQRAAACFERASAPRSLAKSRLHQGDLLLLAGEPGAARLCFVSAYEAACAQTRRDESLATHAAASLADLDYESGLLQAAGRAVAEARHAMLASQDFDPVTLETVLRVDAHTAYARNGLDEVQAVLSLGDDIARRRRWPHAARLTRALRLHFAVGAGETAMAESLIASEGAEFPRHGLTALPGQGWRAALIWAMTCIRFDILCGRLDAAEAALRVTRHALSDRIFALARMRLASLEAILLYARGDAQMAVSQVRDLLGQGDALDLKAFYLEQGPLALDLLREAARRLARSRSDGGVNQQLIRWLIAAPGHLAPEQRRTAPSLSPQQRRILDLLVAGNGRTETARRAETSIYNVQYHLKSLFTLFGVDSTIHLIAEARRLDVGPCGDPRQCS